MVLAVVAIGAGLAAVLLLTGGDDDGDGADSADGGESSQSADEEQIEGLVRQLVDLWNNGECDEAEHLTQGRVDFACEEFYEQTGGGQIEIESLAVEVDGDQASVDVALSFAGEVDRQTVELSRAGDSWEIADTHAPDDGTDHGPDASSEAPESTESTESTDSTESPGATASEEPDEPVAPTPGYEAAAQTADRFVALLLADSCDAVDDLVIDPGRSWCQAVDELAPATSNDLPVEVQVGPDTAEYEVPLLDDAGTDIGAVQVLLAKPDRTWLVVEAKRVR